MNDIITVQHSLFRGLRSCSLFDNVNVVLEREFLQEGSVDYASIWQMPRNGKGGAGLLVEVPALEVPAPNSLQRNLVFSVVVLEERNLNFVSGHPTINGTGKSAEEWGVVVLDFMFGWLLAGCSAMVPQQRALARAKDFVDIMAYRATVSMRREHRQTDRVAPVVIASAGLNVTLTCATAGAAIYYTTDGFSFPGSDNNGSLPGEQAATLYNAPFAVVSGTTVKAAAYKNSLLPSHEAGATIT